MKRILFLLLIGYLFSGQQISAQADISMVTHWFNRANYNPATITKPDYIYIFTNIHSQWKDIKGAPRTVNVQASGYINSLQSAFGVSLITDRIGVSNVLNSMVTYAYRISQNSDWSLSFGLSGGFYRRTIDISLYNPEISIDPSISSAKSKEIKPDANIGVEFENSHLIFGVSSTHLFSYNKTDKMLSNSNHRYGYAIYKNTTAPIINYSAGIQFVNRNNLSYLEFNSLVSFKKTINLLGEDREYFDLGLTYRTTNQISFLIGINLSRSFKLAYAYDLNLFPGFLLNETNELSLQYRIPNKTAKTSKDFCNCESWYF